MINFKYDIPIGKKCSQKNKMEGKGRERKKIRVPLTFKIFSAFLLVKLQDSHTFH